MRSRKKKGRQGDFGKTIFEIDAENGPHPTDCSIFLNKNHPLSHVTVSGMPRDLQSIECRVAWASESRGWKQRIGAIEPSKGKETAVEELKRKIREVAPELEEKAFSDDEVRAMSEMNIDYITHLLERPEELKEVVKRYALAKKASREDGVAEVYSPPRVANKAANHGLNPGWSLDLTVADPYDGQPWDFTLKEKRKRAEELLRSRKPWILVGSPPCTDFSQIQVCNRPRWTEWENERRMMAARVHLEFCIHLYQIQLEEGRLFLHEHPARATSWKEAPMMKLMSKPGVLAVRGDMCQFKMQIPQSKEGEFC